MMKSLNSDFPYSQIATLVVRILHQWFNKPMASTLSLSSLLPALLFSFSSWDGIQGLTHVRQALHQATYQPHPSLSC